MRGWLADGLRRLAEHLDPADPNDDADLQPSEFWYLRELTRPLTISTPVDTDRLWRGQVADYAAYIDDEEEPGDWRGGVYL